MRLALAVYELTSKFPAEERFGLTSQMRRCAVSIPSNIAEEHARLSTREYLRHISVGLGSLAELETQMHLANELGYFTMDSGEEYFARMDRLGKQLRSLIKSLRMKIDRAG